jgi:hypothetical protein
MFILQRLGSDLANKNNNILIKSKSRFPRFDYTKVRESIYGFVVVPRYLCMILETLTWRFPGFSFFHNGELNSADLTLLMSLTEKQSDRHLYIL